MRMLVPLYSVITVGVQAVKTMEAMRAARIINLSPLFKVSFKKRNISTVLNLVITKRIICNDSIPYAWKSVWGASGFVELLFSIGTGFGVK
jgi:hypothetical protein